MLPKFSHTSRIHLEYIAYPPYPHSQANDIEACVVRSDNLKFTRLTADELEAHLTALAERDDDVAGRD